MENLNKYNDAFAIISPNWQDSVPELVRKVLVFVAQNSKLDDLDQAALKTRLFKTYDDQTVLKCLSKIQDIDKESKR